MKYLNAISGLLLMIACINVSANPNINHYYNVERGEAFRRYASEIFNQNYKKLSKDVIVAQAKKVLPGCGFIAGNDARTEQLKNIQFEDLEFVGFKVYSVVHETDARGKTEYASTPLTLDVRYKIAAAHGAEAIYVGVAFESQDINKITGYSIDESRSDEWIINIYHQLPMDKNNKVVIDRWTPTSSGFGCSTIDPRN